MMKSLGLSALIALSSFSVLADHHVEDTSKSPAKAVTLPASNTLFAFLGLSDELTQQLDAMPQQLQQEKAKAWQALTQASAFDEVKEKALSQEAAQQQSQAILIKAKSENAMYNVLTVEQKKQLEEKRQTALETMKSMTKK